MLFLLLKKITKNSTIAIATSLFFASGEIFWSQAIRAEVYGLNTAFMLAVLLLAYVWFEQRETKDFRQANKTLLWLALLYGLSIGNHHLMLMMGPPLALFVLLVQPKILLEYQLLAKALGYFALGLAIYLFLPIRASYQPVINWGNPVTWQSFWDHVTRKIYSVEELNALYQPVKTVASASKSLKDFLADQINFAQKFVSILRQNYTWVVGILALIGMVFAWKRAKTFFFFLLSLIIFYSFVLSAVIGLGDRDKVPLALFTERPFYIPLLMLMVFLAGLGIKFLVDAIFKNKTLPAKYQFMLLIFFGMVASLWLFFQIPANNQSDNYIAYDIAKNSLASLPPNAVLHSENGDNTLFPILYLQKVENFRTDIQLYINMPNSIYPFFESLEKLEAENQDRPIFTDFPFVYYPDKTYRFLGPFSQIISIQGSPSNDKSIRTVSENNIRGWNKSNLDHFHIYLKARLYLDEGLATSDSDEQAKLFEKAFTTAPESQNITGQLIGNYLVLHGKYASAIPYLQRAHELMPHEYPINFQLILALIMSDQPDKAMQQLSTLSPEDKNLSLQELNTLGNQTTYQKVGKFLDMSLLN